MEDAPANVAAGSAARLDYAPPRKTVRRRILRFIVLMIPLVAGIAAIHKRQAIAGQWCEVRTKFWRERCVHYLGPAQQVIYEEDPTRAANLLRSDDFASCGRPFPPGAARRRVRSLEHYLAAASSGSGPTPTSVTWYAGIIGGEAVLFCHELNRPEGKVIVIITYAQQIVQSKPRSFFRVFVCDRQKFCEDLVPQSWEHFVFRDETQPATQATTTPAATTMPFRPVRFFAGELVPDDPCSCRISYQLGEEWGRYTFTLKADNEIERTRDGPLPP